MGLLTIKKIRVHKNKYCNLCSNKPAYWVELYNGAEAHICMNCLKDRLSIPGQQGFRVFYDNNNSVVEIKQDFYNKKTPDIFITKEGFGSSYLYNVSILMDNGEYFSIVSRIQNKTKANKCLKEVQRIPQSIWKDFEKHKADDKHGYFKQMRETYQKCLDILYKEK